MSCCGEPNQPKGASNRVTSNNGQPVTQQPGPHPGAQLYEKQNAFQQPAISAPTPTHPHSQNSYGQNGIYPQTQPQAQPPATWGHHSSSPPPVNSFGAYGSPGLPAQTSSTFNGSMLHQPLLQPSPVLNSPFRTTSPPTQIMSSTVNMAVPRPEFKPPSDEGKMSVSIDFGTTFSGVAYGSSRIAAGKIQQILHWPGSFETFRKVPTCLLYDEQGQVIAWGLEAKNASPMLGTTRCEWFKLFLEPHALRDETAIDPRLPQIPPGKKPLNLIIDFLSCLWEYAKEQITREIGAVADLNSANIWLTVPAAWDAKGCDMMREAAISAQLVQSSHAGDRDWRDRLRIITEPEAAAVHCAHLTDLHKLKPSQNFMICDAGGGTVDLAVYKIIGEMANLEIAEMCARSGANCGSIFLDLRFRQLVQTLLADHPAHLDAASLAYFMHSFSETDKLAYMGESDDDNMFHFTTFNVDDPHDPSVGLVNGELAIPGNLLRREVFDPVISDVLHLVEEQTRRIDQKIDALLLVGGFSGSEYLYKRVEEQFGSRIKVIARPADADTATARGAAQYGLAGKTLITTVITPRAYLMKVKLPADPEDWQKRPAYIKDNNAGIPICENRLQYLVHKGAILRKGQRVRTKFCKYSQNSQDCVFVAVLYTSDADKVMRYTDEGATDELCKWTVDIGSLPTFQRNASTLQTNGFYTEFELGLELDSAEVRGILLYEGQEWGRVVFDFLNQS